MEFIQGKQVVAEYDSTMLLRGLRTALSNDEGICYYRYPFFFVDKSRQAPDILLLHRQLGLYVIDCRPWRIGDIETIDQGIWSLKYKEEKSLETPYFELEDQLHPISSKFMTERDLRRGRNESVICGHLFLALPHVYKSEWREKRFDTLFDSPPAIDSN